MMEWISVEDRLPSEEEIGIFTQFLVVCKTFGGYDGFFQHVEKAEFYPYEPANEYCSMPRSAYWELIDSPSHIPFQVTHWMPLPEAPK
jgi:hypothetical protein